MGFELPGGDHQVTKYADKMCTLFMDNTSRLKIIRQSENSGTGTISSSGVTVTGSGTAFTTSSRGCSDALRRSG